MGHNLPFLLGALLLAIHAPVLLAMSDQNTTLLLQIISIVFSALTTIAVSVAGLWIKISTDAHAEKVAAAAEKVRVLAAQTIQDQKTATKEVRETLKENAASAVADRSEVKATLQVTTTDVNNRLDVIHGLVNSGLGIVLEEAADTAREGAAAAEELAHAKPTTENIAKAARARQKADVAAKASEYHTAKQKAVDQAQAQAQAPIPNNP